MPKESVNKSKKKEQKFWQKKPEIKKGLNNKFVKSLIYFGGPHRNRTYNLLIKSQVLCLVELVAPNVPYIDDRKSLVTSLLPDVNFFLGIRLGAILFLDWICRIYPMTRNKSFFDLTRNIQNNQ